MPSSSPAWCGWRGSSDWLIPARPALRAWEGRGSGGHWLTPPERPGRRMGGERPGFAASIGWSEEPAPFDGFSQVWSLGRAGERLLAGTKPATLLVSDDDGVTWEKVKGLRDHPSAPEWGAGCRGAGAAHDRGRPRGPGAGVGGHLRRWGLRHGRRWRDVGAAQRPRRPGGREGQRAPRGAVGRAHRVLRAPPRAEPPASGTRCTRRTTTGSGARPTVGGAGATSRPGCRRPSASLVGAPPRPADDLDAAAQRGHGRAGSRPMPRLPCGARGMPGSRGRRCERGFRRRRASSRRCGRG